MRRLLFFLCLLPAFAGAQITYQGVPAGTYAWRGVVAADSGFRWLPVADLGVGRFPGQVKLKSDFSLNVWTGSAWQIISGSGGSGTVTTVSGLNTTGITWSITNPTTTPSLALSITKAAVGLAQVDNTADANKPVSTAQATALAAKQATLVSGTNIKTINGTSLLGSGDISVSGGGGTQTLSIAGSQLSISGGNTVTLPASGGTAPRRYAPMLIIWGESNTAGQGTTTATRSTAELAIRPRGQIVNNNTLAIEPYHMKYNSNLHHANITDSSLYYAFENGFISATEAGKFKDTILYNVKFGQGGSLLSQWARGGTYYNGLIQRILIVKAHCDSVGETILPIMAISIGINDAGSGTPDSIYKALYVQTINNIRNDVGICMPAMLTLFTGVSGMSAYNARIQEIANEQPNVYAISDVGVSYPDTKHLDNPSMDTITARMIRTYTDSIGQREAYVNKVVQEIAGHPQYVAPPTAAYVDPNWVTVSDKYWDDISTWQQYAVSGSNAFTTSGGVTLLNTTGAAWVYKSNAFTVGDSIRITLEGVTVLSGQPYIYIDNGSISGSDFTRPFGSGTTVTTLGTSSFAAGHNTLTLIALNTGTDHFYMRRTKIERYVYPAIDSSDSRGIKNISATYTAIGGDNTINCTAAGYTVALPAAATCKGKKYNIKNSAASGTITVDPAGSETIDGATTFALSTQYSVLQIQSTGTNWINLNP